MDRASGTVIAFMLISIFLIGFFLVMPSSYDRLDELELGPQGNETLDTAYTLVLNLQGIFGFLFIMMAAFTAMGAMMYIFGGRR